MVSFIMMMGYVFWDVVSPLSTTLKAPIAEGGMGWTSAEYGFFAGSYSIFNIFLLMLFFGGIILDKTGIRFTGVLATGLMLGGAAVNWYAINAISPLVQAETGFTLFGLIPQPVKLQVLVSSLGFGLFGVGCDITGITISKIVTKWFTGYELASAMGIQVSMARLGTASAISFSPVIADVAGLSAPFLVGTILLLIGFVTFLSYTLMDKKFDKEREALRQEVKKEEDNFSFRDFMTVLRNPGFWLIAFLCVFFYSSIRGTIVLTPFFGNLYDRIGKGATLMLIGCTLVTVCHLCLALPIIQQTWFASIIMILLGVSFSLVPSAMWPSVPKIVPLKQLGTAYSIIYYVQNIGLMLVPMWIGNLIGDYTAADGKVDFTVPMMVFMLFGVISILIAFALKIMDGKKQYGLENNKR